MDDLPLGRRRAGEPIAERLAAVRPDYYYNGVYAILGAYHALRPKILGGDTVKARANFDEALKGPGTDFLLNKFMAAKMYAVAAQDQEHFKNLLQRVSESPAGALPNARLADEVAKEKAKILMEKMDEYF